MWSMPHPDTPDDYAIAIRVTDMVRGACRIAFDRVGPSIPAAVIEQSLSGKRHRAERRFGLYDADRRVAAVVTDPGHARPCGLLRAGVAADRPRPARRETLASILRDQESRACG